MVASTAAIEQSSLRSPSPSSSGVDPGRPNLRLDRVSKAFGSFQAINGFSLEVQPGECLGLLGPNGAGKTTSLRLALGLTHADAGEVELLGYNMRTEGASARARVGVVPQQDALDPDFTVRENLEVFARYFDMPKPLRDQRIAELLQFASLEKRSTDRVTALSGGLKRRLTLARALINDPQMIFLDEPTTALDPQARHLIWERLQSLRDQGRTLLLTTHFMDEAQRLCDRIVIVDGGRLVAEGTPRALIEQHIGSEVIEVFGREAAQRVAQCIHQDPGARVETSGETVFVYTNAARDWPERLGRMDYLYRPANLEDVFLRLTGRDLRDA